MSVMEYLEQTCGPVRKSAGWIIGGVRVFSIAVALTRKRG